MIMYLHYKVDLESDVVKKINKIIKEYNTFFEDVAKSPIGKYSIDTILETVEEALNYLEIFTPILCNWLNKYLEEHRGKLWLYYGLKKGTYLTDYWKQEETSMDALQKQWPFLFIKREYKGFNVDLEGAQNEILRQRKRQSTNNPNYTPFHPDGCPGSCSCWMLDDMEQWYSEEQAEIKASNNIFFNTRLQEEFYELAINDLYEFKEQWTNWIPDKSTIKIYNDNLTINQGQTPISVVQKWIKSDFYYCSIFGMFEYSDIFTDIWNTIDSIEPFIRCQREKLKTIISLL